MTLRSNIEIVYTLLKINDFGGIMMNIERVKDMFFYIVDLLNVYAADGIGLIMILILCSYFNTCKDKGRKCNFIFVFKDQCKQIFLNVLVCVTLGALVYEVVEINLLEVLKFKKYWRLYLCIYSILFYRSGFRLFRRLQISDYVDRVKSEEKEWLGPEVIFTNRIKGYQAQKDMEKEKLNIYKAISPISLVPVILGQYMQDTNVKINWDKFFMAFCCLLLVYFFLILKAYRKMKDATFTIMYFENEYESYKVKKAYKKDNVSTKNRMRI